MPHPSHFSQCDQCDHPNDTGWGVQIYLGADKSLARPGREQVRKHVRDARDFNNIETRAVIKFFLPPAEKAPKEIHAILTETLTCFLPCRAKDLPAPLYSSSLCSFLHSPLTLSFLGPNILLNTIFSNTLSLCSTLNLRDQDSHPYKTTGKIIIQNYHNTTKHITNILRPVFRRYSVFATVVQIIIRIEMILQR